MSCSCTDPRFFMFVYKVFSRDDDVRDKSALFSGPAPVENTGLSQSKTMSQSYHFKKQLYATNPFFSVQTPMWSSNNKMNKKVRGIRKRRSVARKPKRDRQFLFARK